MKHRHTPPPPTHTTTAGVRTVKLKIEIKILHDLGASQSGNRHTAHTATNPYSATNRCKLKVLDQLLPCMSGWFYYGVCVYVCVCVCVSIYSADVDTKRRHEEKEEERQAGLQRIEVRTALSLCFDFPWLVALWFEKRPAPIIMHVLHLKSAFFFYDF